MYVFACKVTLFFSNMQESERIIVNNERFFKEKDFNFWWIQKNDVSLQFETILT